MFTEFYQILKQELPTLLQLFYKIEREGTAPNSLYKASATLIPNPDKDRGKKGKKMKNKPISMMNIDAIILNKILTNKTQNTLKRSNVTTEQDSFWRLASTYLSVNIINTEIIWLS